MAAPYVPNSEHLVEAWEGLEKVFEDLDITDIYLNRDDSGLETIDFEYDKKSFVIEFPSNVMENVTMRSEDGFMLRMDPFRDGMAEIVRIVLIGDAFTLKYGLPKRKFGKRA